MKIRCRCGLCLTSSLYPRKTWVKAPPKDDTGEEVPWPESAMEFGSYSIQKGSFMARRGSLRGDLHEQRRLLINPADLIVDNLLPTFQGGMGCCDLAWVDLHCPQCDRQIGQANLDCYQDKHVRFYERQVIRDYGRFGVRRPAKPKPVRRRFCYPPGMGFFGMD